MTTIRLLDARRGLNRKCEELFGDAKIAEAIYRYLCDGIEECEDAEPERKKGKWEVCNILDYAQRPTGRKILRCPFCEYLTDDFMSIVEGNHRWTNFCPNCGAEMVKGEDDDFQE